MKNKYYESFEEFENTVERFFLNFTDSLQKLKAFLSFKFIVVRDKIK